MLTPQNNNQAEKQNKLYKLDKEIFRALSDESSDEAATGRRIVRTADAASEAVSNACWLWRWINAAGIMMCA